MTKLVEHLHVEIEELFKDCAKTFRQLDEIPSCLISNLNMTVHNSSKIISKYNFVMSLEDFEQSFKPHFKDVETRTFTETYYDAKDDKQSIMKRNVWVKLVEGYGKDSQQVPMVSIKRAYQDTNGELCYKEKVMDMNTATMEFPIILELCKENQYKIDVQRTKYVHEHDINTTLTLDRVTYPDDSSFVVFSLTCDFEAETSNQGSINNKLYPCRNKIIEFLYHNKHDLYDHLLKTGSVSKMDYKSMSIAEFEKGVEVAQQYRKEAEEEVKKLKETNEQLDEPEYSEKYISFVKRNILKYGRRVDNEEDCECQ